jgi:conjugal transfer pilus assembly protein TraB
MTEKHVLTAQEEKTKQYIILLIVACFVIMVIGGIYYVIQMDAKPNPNKIKKEFLPFTSPVTAINTQSVWIERIQNKFKQQEKETVELKNELSRLKNNENQSIDQDPQYQQLVKQNQLLQQALKESNENTQRQPDPLASQGRINTKNALQNSENTVGIDTDILDLKNANDSPKKNPDSFVPAGTFAEAIMLGAADASAGVQSQTTPTPMLFRLVADGTLPNHKKSHLKDCVATAAVVGDISSERGQIRLERLSCTFPNGEIVEQAVEGTVFGMDAKNGVRGTPVWREGALLSRAALSGTLSGLSNAVSQAYTTTSISPLGSTQTVNNGDILKYGAAQGASNAMEKLADYNIKRAEQYHPVIQLSAGQSVDIVFLCGFYLDGRPHPCKEGSEHENKEEPHQLFSSPKVSGLTLSERELAKIEKNEENMGWINKD